MLQSKIRIKLKKKYVKDDSSNKKTSQKNLKLFNCDEKNREKIERMKEKIKIIQEKISSFKDSQITTTKRKSNNKNAIEKNLSEGEINHEKIKDIKLLNKKNLKLNFNQCEQFKSAYQSYSNNFYTNTRQKKPNNKISEDKSMNYTQNFSSHQKDYYLFKKKKDNLKKKCNNNDSNIIDSTYREKYNQLKNKGNYSIDKENISLDKNINFNSLEINHIYNHIKKDFIYPYLPSKNKINSEKNLNENKNSDVNNYLIKNYDDNSLLSNSSNNSNQKIKSFKIKSKKISSSDRISSCNQIFLSKSIPNYSSLLDSVDDFELNSNNKTLKKYGSYKSFFWKKMVDLKIRNKNKDLKKKEHKTFSLINNFNINLVKNHGKRNENDLFTQVNKQLLPELKPVIPKYSSFVKRNGILVKYDLPLRINYGKNHSDII